MPTKYVKKTPEEKALGRERRLRAHRHNSYMGHIAMARHNFVAIMHADTATDQAKDTASQIVRKIDILRELLKTRQD